jgi:hypothetical protein
MLAFYASTSIERLESETFHCRMDKTAGASQEQSVKVFAPSHKAGSLGSTTGPSTTSLRNVSHSLSRMHLREGASTAKGQSAKSWVHFKSHSLTNNWEGTQGLYKVENGETIAENGHRHWRSA